MMNLRRPRLLCLLVVFLLALGAGRADEPAIIAKARAYLGPEAALNAVTSVHYRGTLVTTDPKDPQKETRAKLDIVYRRPDQQRISALAEKTMEITALDDFEAWQKISEIGDAAKWRQTLLSPDQVRRLRANTQENLGFFRGLEKHGGQVEDQGPATIDGVACEKIAFRHSSTIIFFRYFSLESGKLVYTETESGGNIREQGEIMAGEIRFPRSLVTQTRNTAGQEQKVTITFDSVTLNEEFPANFFAVPLVRGR